MAARGKNARPLSELSRRAVRSELCLQPTDGTDPGAGEAGQRASILAKWAAIAACSDPTCLPVTIDMSRRWFE